MLRQSRSDITQLLPNGRLSETIPKAKQFYEDERRLLAYDQVEYFCTSILKDISVLHHQSDVHLLPDVTKEAMAGLIFAASRIGELNELQYIRCMFVERFGLQFDKECVGLRRGNVVGSEIVKILDTKLPQDEITNIVMELSRKHQTNITTSADSVSEDPDAEKMERMKSVVRRMLLQSNLGESPQARDGSFMR
ncbi:hypothetical protein CARUB_v10015166mg [Capsella rubella]|uniref:Uncharacterized protein n=1 Tax=Capsella rubella TaxID=81985 RepID=R0G8H2_9BRAS|nr:uncharacterized protein LOC17893907 [Capsella rubella]EOA31927.1 hypothetical protein CARUB_v10015166mg [Capsella rubella]